MVNYETIYPGTSYLLDSKYNFTGYRVPTGQLGATTSIQTSNQLKEVSNLLNQGMKATEISVINPDVFEMIPKGMFKEINRVNKLTGAESTLHAPIIDPSGFTQQGWSRENREIAERQFMEVIERSHEIDPKGNVPVTIHSSANVPGSEVIPKDHPLVLDKEKDIPGDVYGRIIAVEQETGKAIPLTRDERFYPGRVKDGKQGVIIYTPEEELNMANQSTVWNELSQLTYYKQRGDELINKNLALVGSADPDDPNLSDQQKLARQNVEIAETYLENTSQSLRSIFNKTYKYSDDDAQEKLRKASEQYAKELQKAYTPKGANISMQSTAINNLISTMQKVVQKHPPKIYEKVEVFAKNKASETLSNVAKHAYKKFGETAPIISVENPPYGEALSSAKDLKELLVETRKKFVDKMVKDGTSRGEAEAAAKKLIGATWDTSHISLIRRQGFDKKRLVDEARTIAPFVKHVHFNDNFGTTHTDLPPGMGDVPFKEVMGELEKKGFEGKKIFEGGNFFQNFKISPYPFNLEYSGSPLYEGTPYVGPYWNQLGGLGNYYGGHGEINPAVHHTVYGSGFSNLPMELGGNVQGGGDRSRFSGTPTA